MIVTEYNSLCGDYRINLSFDNEDGIFIRIPMLFDTGAGLTVISARDLYSCKNDEFFNLLKKNLIEADSYSVPFRSVTDDEFRGYYCTIRDVVLGNEKVELFCFYLVFEQLNNCVLGNDFISCCNFRHEPHSPIVIDEFQDKYFESINENVKSNKSPVALNTVVSTVLKDIDIKNEATAFREIYDKKSVVR